MHCRRDETKKTLGQTLAVAVMLTACTAAFGADEDDGARSGCICGLGAAAAVESKPYRGEGTKTDPIPLISYENRWIRLLGPNLDFKFTPGPLSLAARLNYEFDSGYKASDASNLKGMAERKPGLWAGPAVKWHNELADITASYLFDATNDSKGQKATLAVEHSFRFGNFEWVPIVSVTELNHKYVDYYYGVRATEATATRAAYKGKSATNFDAAFRTSYLFANKHLVFMQLGVTQLGSAVKDSPIVGRSVEPHMWLGYIYRF